ncbi:MAG: glycosyltransferase family 4 protein [Patescibacteria group bacterium]|nr:glycosyltransferase family 4 protein [Patescibacteria group bacterium]MCL5095143.1 glycosyltransferase family 4 protein [Patescibacteria group bacterium]
MQDKTKTLLIGVDGNEANFKTRVGVGRYAFELLKQFDRYQESSINYQVYLKNKPSIDLPNETERWKYKIVGPKKLWTQLGLPLALLKNKLSEKEKIDVFFTPTHYAPRFCPFPRVVSVMDLSFLKYPEMFKKSDLYQLKNWTAYSVKKARKVLTISQASKRDIIKYYQIAEDKVVVTYPGLTQVTSIKYQVLSMEEIKKKYGIENDYILSVGTLQPRKNFVKLIEAFSSLNPNPYTLVIVGKPGWLYREIYEAPRKFGVERKVKFLDYVPDEDLPALYQKAKCFVLVSLYEGFGLPVLEALNYGCPVVTSNTSSLPEVVGEAGILVDPNDSQDIIQGLEKVLTIESDERMVLIEKGKIQASKFSWEKCAKETLNVLKQVGEKHV